MTLSCGGAPIEIIRQYIEQQKTPNQLMDTFVSVLSIPDMNDGVFRTF